MTVTVTGGSGTAVGRLSRIRGKRMGEERAAARSAAPAPTNSLHAPAAEELLSSYGIDLGILARAHQPDTARVLPAQDCKCGCVLKCAFAPCLLACSALRVLCCSAKPRHPAWGKMVSRFSVRVWGRAASSRRRPCQQGRGRLLETPPCRASHTRTCPILSGDAHTRALEPA